MKNIVHVCQHIHQNKQVSLTHCTLMNSTLIVPWKGIKEASMKSTNPAQDEQDLTILSNGVGDYIK